MRKLITAFVVVVLIISLAACGRRQDATPTTNSTAQPTTIPFNDPTLDTNIPDPHINTEVPTYTDGSDPIDDILPDPMN